MPSQRSVPYVEAKRWINDGDLLLFRRNWKPSSFLISRVGRSEYVHAGKVAWEAGELRLLDVMQFHGGRNLSLLDQVRRFPGWIDVFEVNPNDQFSDYDRQAAVQWMCRFHEVEYGWFNIVRLSLLHLAFFRLFFRADTQDAATRKGPPFCSQAVAEADRLGGGVDPTPNLADRLVEPGDLARSLLYRYRFTLRP